MIKVNSFDEITSANCELINYNNSSFNFNSNIIPRGAGLSPRLMSASEGLKSVIIGKKNSNLEFDFNIINKTVEIDANYTFAEVNKAAFEFNLQLPVIGYSSIQIGSGIASCIHGKNHFQYDFGDHIESFKLLSFSNEIINCSKNENRLIFDLTIGGYGSTGLILSAVINLIEINSTTIERERKSISSIDDFINHYKDENINSYNGMFGWHNLHVRNKNFGRGFLYRDVYLNNDLFMPEIYPVKPAHHYKPSKIYKSGKLIFGKFFNTAYEIKEKLTKNISNFNVYSEAISSKNIYWSIMRANGFIETQYIVSFNQFKNFSQYLDNLIIKDKPTTSVCITKPVRNKRKYLRFRGDGINIDITGLKTSKNLNFFKKLNKDAYLFGAIPNIVKCSILDLKDIESSYGNSYHKFLLDYKKAFNKNPPSWFLKNGKYIDHK